MAKTQLRGNCPCCGREQAVLASGCMSAHGYTTKNGWFEGVCNGWRYQPMQVNRSVTDEILFQVRADVLRLLDDAEQLKTGRKYPEYVITKRRPKGVDDKIKFADASVWQQEEAVKSAIYGAESRARIGAAFADDLEALLNRVHGKPLREATAPQAPEAIEIGDKRLSFGRVLVAISVHGAKVNYKFERDGKTFKGSTSSRAWRLMEKGE